MMRRRTVVVAVTAALLVPAAAATADGHDTTDRTGRTDRTDPTDRPDRTDPPVTTERPVVTEPPLGTEPPVTDHPVADHPVVTDRVAPDRIDRVDVEALRLECAVRATDAGSAVGCHWSTPTSPRAVSLRLWRHDPATDRERQVVFRTKDLTVNSFLDRQVRPGHAYAYVVQALSADGIVVGRSRVEWVRVPHVHDDVEVLTLRCALGDAAEAIGCRWSRPESRDAYLVTLWRSVDDGPRQVVESFRPTGPNEYRDPVPPGASKVTYAVIATSESDRIVARSRAVTVLVPRPHPYRREVVPF